MRYLTLFALCGSIISGCSLHAMAPSSPSQFAGAGDAHPKVVQRGDGSAWVRLKPHTLGALGAGIIAGPDGNMWFIDENAGELVRLSMNGAIKEFPMNGFLGGSAIALTVGADQRFYVANESSKIVRVTTSGIVRAFTNKSGDDTALGDIALGPDGNVWFPERAHLATIDRAGKITEFPYPSGFGVPNQVGTIATGADHNLWFTESGDNALVRFVIPTHTFTEFKIATQCSPAGPIKAKDNNLWFTCTVSTEQVGRITTSGNIKLFPGGGAFSGEETFQIATLGADGEPWYSSPNTETIFRINTANGTVTSFSPPFVNGERPDSVAAGPDGNIWVTTVGLNNVYIRVFNPTTLTPRVLTFTGIGQSQTFTVSENGTTHWKATSSNTAVAMVTQGSNAGTFKVTSTGTGKCRINVADAIGNSSGVTLTVR